MKYAKDELRELLEESIDKKELTDTFTLAARKIAYGYLNEKSRWFDPDIQEEIISDFFLRLVKGWSKIDPDSNISSYLIGMVRFAIMDWERKSMTRKRREEAYVEVQEIYLEDEHSGQGYARHVGRLQYDPEIET